MKHYRTFADGLTDSTGKDYGIEVYLLQSSRRSAMPWTRLISMIIRQTWTDSRRMMSPAGITTSKSSKDNKRKRPKTKIKVKKRNERNRERKRKYWFDWWWDNWGASDQKKIVKKEEIISKWREVTFFQFRFRGNGLAKKKEPSATHLVDNNHLKQL